MNYEHGDELDELAIAIHGVLTDGAWSVSWPDSIDEVTAAYRLLEPWAHDEYRAAAREVRAMVMAKAAPVWVDAPTHDGLWWTRATGVDDDVILVHRRSDSEGGWSYEVHGDEGVHDILRLLSRGHKFAPAMPPALPKETT